MVTADLNAWAQSRRIFLTSQAKEELMLGFGTRESGEDPFDAFMGLLSMIEVVSGRRPESPVSLALQVTRWEGWILGQSARNDPGSNSMSMN
jgi:hypothetical protein